MATSSGLHNLKSQKLYIRVYDEIKEYIFRNNLQPGDKLPTEMELCEALGVSRNVLRESIKALEITGLVRSKPGVGIIIRNCNMDFFMSTLVSQFSAYRDPHLQEYIEELRRILEIGFMDHAFDSITEEDKKELASLVDIMQKKGKTQAKSKTAPSFGIAFAKADASFHRTLFCHVQNRLMTSIIDFFWAYDETYKMKSTHDHLNITIDKHKRIYEALRDHDRNAFHDAMYYHFNYDYSKK